MEAAGGGGGGGRFDFDDGGAYAGGWADGKAHGHGVCTGPKGRGEYSGSWSMGFEVSGVYTWPGGVGSYEGQWANGKRHGMGVETRGRWVYRGEWTDGFKGRYGCRQSIASPAKYDGTWANGLQDGYGSETYADGGTFQGQWAKGMRHGYGVRSSAPFGLAAHTRRQSLRKSPAPGEPPSPDRRPEESRGGFVLKDRSSTWGRSLPDHSKTSTLKSLMSKTKRGEHISYEEEFSDGGSDSDATDSSFVVQDEAIDGNVIETYMGEWKNDKRSGFGIAERSDGIKYEGEWYNNKKFGYGRTTYKNGLEERGKYKHNILLESGGRKHLFMLRSAKLRERVEAAGNAAHRASQIALQKADIAISRTATARGKAEQSSTSSKHSRSDSDIARMVARQYAPEFQQLGTEYVKRKLGSSQGSSEFGPYPEESLSHRSYPSSGQDYYPKEYEDQNYLSPEPPSHPTSAFLDLFKNNPDRRPSAAGFLRRPSAIGAHRRPSTVVELSIVPSLFDPRPEPVANRLYQRPPPQLSFQQVVDDHFQHYYEPSPSRTASPQGRKTPRPAIDYTELSLFYGIPLSGPRMDPDLDEDPPPFIPQRRCTLPTAIEQNSTDPELVRTGSLYTATRKAEAVRPGGMGAGARKKSLPDISSMGDSEILSREAIAFLSSQRREAIRREEEEAMRLRQNPFLYLVSPEVWDWLASQQMVILVIVINVALGFLFFKVIL